MVALLMRMKAKLTWNSMKRQTAFLVLSILGALGIASYVGMIAVGAVFSIFEGYADLASVMFTLISALAVLAWVIAPALMASADNTLDPVRLAPFAAPSRRFAIGMIAAAFVGFAGIGTALFLLIPFVAWIVSGHVVVALVSVISACLALAISLVWSRAVTTWMSVQMTASTRRRDLQGVIATVALFLFVTPLGLYVNAGIDNFNAAFVTRLGTIVGWTPMGAPFAISQSVYEGNYLVALARLAISLVTLWAGWKLWQYVLPFAMNGKARPVSAEARQAIAEGRHLIDPTQAAPSARADQRSFKHVDPWLRLGLPRAAAALAARTSHEFIRDPRLLSQLIAVGVLPVLGIAISFMGSNSDFSFGNTFAIFFTLFGAMLFGGVVATLMAWDSTANWLSITAGIRGRDERLGRLVGALPSAISLFAVVMALLAFAAGIQGRSLIYLAVTTVLLFCATAGAGQILHARWLYPVPPPGTNPISTKSTGSFTATMLVQFAQWLAALVASLPASVVLLLGFFGILPDWIGYIVAPVWSLVCLVVGVIVGGRMWDRHAVTLLQQIKAWPGHAKAA